MRNTAAVTGSKPIAVLLQSISGVSAINPLVDFYDIHGRNREQQKLRSSMFERSVQFQGGLTSGRPVVKIIAESLSQHDEKHVVPTPLSRIRVGGRRRGRNREVLFFYFDPDTTRDFTYRFLYIYLVLP
jgi:hypothetical protein